MTEIEILNNESNETREKENRQLERMTEIEISNNDHQKRERKIGKRERERKFPTIPLRKERTLGITVERSLGHYASQSTANRTQPIRMQIIPFHTSYWSN